MVREVASIMSGKSKRILVGLGAVAGLIVIGLILLVLFFPADMVKDRAVAEMEERLKRPVHVGDVGLTLFPSLGAKLSDLRIGDAVEPGRPRIEAESIRLNVRLWPLIRRQLEISSVEIDGLEVEARLGKPEDTSGPEGGHAETGAGGESSGSMAFVVDRMKLSGGKLSVFSADGAPLLALRGVSEVLKATATSTGDLRLEGQTAIDSISVYLPSGEMGRGMKLKLEKKLRYDRAADSLHVERADMDLNGLPIAVTGAAAGIASGLTSIDIMLNGGPGEVSDVLGYLPADVFSQMKGVESKGTIRARGAVSGPIGRRAARAAGRGLGFRIELTMTDGSIVHPELADPIEDIAFHSSFTSREIEIRDLRMRSGSSTIRAGASVSNYKNDPTVAARVDLDLDLEEYSRLRGQSGGDAMAGRAEGRVTVHGPVRHFDQVKVSGNLDLSSVRVGFEDGRPSLENVNGRVSIGDSDITVQDLSGNMGSSDFSARGSISNYAALLPGSTETAPARVDLTVRSKLLALDELTSGGESANSKRGGSRRTTGTPAEKTAGLLSSLTGTIDFSADRVTTVETDLIAAHGLATVDRGLINLERIDAELYGGSGAIQGTIDYRDPAEPRLDLKLQLQKVGVSDFLSSSKSAARFSRMGGFLSGEMDANATLRGNLNEARELNLDSVTSIGDLSLRGAEVVNHPIQVRLADYLETPELKTLAISEWFQPFRVEDGRVYVEKLSIKSKSIELSASGWQSLDGTVEMDFDVLLPRDLSDGLRKRVPAELVPVLFEGTSSRILAPINVRGSYNSPSVALNTDRLSSQAQEHAKRRLEEERKRLAEEAKRRARGFLDGLIKTGKDKEAEGTPPDTTKSD
jgi:hypothetical protein